MSSLVVTSPLAVISGPASAGAASLALSGTTGAFIFTPDPADTSGATSVYRATYTLTGTGTSGSDAATVTFSVQTQVISVPPISPLAADDSFILQAGNSSSVVFSPSVLSNDASRNAGGSLSVNATLVSAVSPAGKGTVVINPSTGVVTFTPGSGANAPLAGDMLSFTYKATDSTPGAPLSNTATVMITVVSAPGGTVNVSPLLQAFDDVSFFFFLGFFRRFFFLSPYSFFPPPPHPNPQLNQYYATDSRVATTTVVNASAGVRANDVAGAGVTLGNVTLLNPWTSPTGVVCTPICKLSSGTYSVPNNAGVSMNPDGSFSVTLPQGANAASYVFKYNLAGKDSNNTAVTPASATVRVDAYATGTTNFVTSEQDVYFAVAGRSYTGITYLTWVRRRGA